MEFLWNQNQIDKMIQEIKTGDFNQITRIGVLSILEQLKERMIRVDDLLKRNTELVEENRKLKANKE